MMDRLLTPDEIPEHFTPWHGGECPVDPEDVIVIFWADGDCEVEQAGKWRWNHIGKLDHEGVADIIGYRP